MVLTMIGMVGGICGVFALGYVFGFGAGYIAGEEKANGLRK